MVTRGKKRSGIRYYGPYGHAYAIRETLDPAAADLPGADLLGQLSSPATRRLGRPCLLYHIEKCSGPCVGAVSKADYDGHVADLLAFLDGDTDEVVARLGAEMAEASEVARVRAGRRSSATGWRASARPSPSSRWWEGTGPRTST